MEPVNNAKTVSTAWTTDGVASIPVVPSPVKRPVASAGMLVEAPLSRQQPATSLSRTSPAPINVVPFSSTVSTMAPRQKLRISRRRVIGLGLLSLSLVAGIIFGTHVLTQNTVQTDASQQIKPQSISLGGLNTQLATTNPALSTLTVNGQLHVNDSMILRPSARPTIASEGQLYYDQATNQLQYYNGTSFVGLQGGANVVNNTYNNTAVSNTYGNSTTVNNFFSTTASNTFVTTNLTTGASIQGTAGVLALYASGGSSLADSAISQSGAAVSVGGTLALKSGGDSTAAFQVQATSGASLLTADTANAAIIIGNDNTPDNVTIRGGTASGSNVTGGNITIIASNGTGSATSGNITFKTGVSAENGIEFGATSTTHGGGTVTQNVTIGSQPNQLLLVSSDCPMTNMIYNGRPLTRFSIAEQSASHNGSGAYLEVWYLAGPPAGTHSLSGVSSQPACVSGGGGTLGASTYFNVDQTTPLGTPAGATGQVNNPPGNGTATLSVPTSSPSQVVYNTIAFDAGPQTCTSTNSSQTLRWTSPIGKNICNSDSVASGSPSFNVVYILPHQSDWSSIGVTINPATLQSVPLFIASATTPDADYDRLSITANGNVGVNNNSPQYTLDVSGITNASLGVYTPTLDTAAPAALNVGQFNATTIQIGNAISNTPISLQGTTIVKPTTGNDSMTEFQIQNASGTPLLTADTTNMKVTVTALVVTANITVSGHIITGGGTPSIAAGVAACTTPTVTISGNDISGLITVITGSGCASSGALATVTFASVFGAAPHITLTPGTASSAGLQTYVDVPTLSASSFSLGASNTPSSATTYYWEYWIAQ